MKKLLILAGSNGRQSINKALACYVGSQVADVQQVVLDLNDYEMPIYSVDREERSGVPELAKEFVDKIEASDAIALSLSEHNGTYSAAFKNIIDWASRHKNKIWSGKPMFLLSTSPGDRGAVTVLEAAKQSFPHLDANIIATFSLPSYSKNFSPEKGITDLALNKKFRVLMQSFKAII